MDSTPQVAVIQRGARHRYAVPRIFYRMGCLSGLITDSHAGSLWGRIARSTSKYLALPQRAKRLGERVIEGVPDSLIHATDRWMWRESRLQKRYSNHTDTWLQARDASWHSLTKCLIPTSTNIIYTMGGENLAPLIEARNRGTKVMTDAFITPLNLRQTYEAKRAARLVPTVQESQHVAVEAHYAAVFAESDVILCPSRWVAEGVEALDRRFAAKIRICPYGSSITPRHGARRPLPGRIFWAGGDWFRKGLHHLAAAADILLETHPDMEFRIAGISDPAVLAMPAFNNMRFLGQIDRAAMEREFATADMFVFPTLTEGMASVLVESVASGCPVLTTRGAGFDALEGDKGGMLFEAGDPQTLASLIESLYLDRPRLARMANEAAALAAEYTEDAWADRLKRIVSELAYG